MTPSRRAAEKATESKRERNLRIWQSLTPAQRDYDRFVARQIPPGATWSAETAVGREAEAEMHRRIEESGGPESCSCHMSAPCSWCMSQSDEDDA